MNGYLITTSPACTPCPRCRRLQLTGYEEGIPYRAEPAPLTAEAELRAKLAGRRTYAVIAGQLAYRNASRIRNDTRSGGRPTVLAQHSCTHPATETDIETRHLKYVTALIEDSTKQKNATGDTEAEADALFLINKELGGRVIELVDPPF